MCIGWYRSQWCTSQLHITPTHGFSLVLVQLSWVWVTKNPLFTGILPDDGRRSIGFLSIWARPGRGKLISKFKAVANFFCKSPNSCYSNSGMGAESDPFPDELRWKISSTTAFFTSYKNLFEVLNHVQAHHPPYIAFKIDSARVRYMRAIEVKRSTCWSPRMGITPPRWIV